jgi:ADP-ribose diphosphatase
MSSTTSSIKTTLATGRHLRLVERNRWEFVERPGISGIVVLLGLTDHRSIVLVSQWREPVQTWVLELPAGLAGDRPEDRTETLQEAAHREFLEETGFEAASMEPVLTGPPSSGLSSEIVTFYRASGLRRVGPGGGEEGEGVRAHVVPLSRLEEWLKQMQTRGILLDPKVLAGAYLLQQADE